MPKEQAELFETAKDFAEMGEEQLAAVVKGAEPAAAKPPQKAAPAAEPLPAEEEAPEQDETPEEELEPAVAVAEQPEGLTPPEEGADTEKEGSARSEPAKEAPPLTKFQVFDEQGELEVPALKFKFKANGKEREEPLDKVVQLAQMGYYNEEREQQVLAGKQFVQEAQRQRDEAATLAQQYEGYYSRLLEDPAFYEQARQVWQEQNSPAQRAVRAEQEVQALRYQQQLAGEDAQIAGFVSQELTPKVEKLLGQHPHVSFDEVMGRYTTLTAPLLVRGRIPLGSLSQVGNLVDNELTAYARHLEDERSTAERQQSARVKNAKVETALAKRQIARRTAPPAASAPAQPKQKKYATAKDWLEDTLPVRHDED
jgi:hypothetical protein